MVAGGAGGRAPLRSGPGRVIHNKKPTNRRTPREGLTPSERAVLGLAVIDKLRRIDRLLPDLNLAKDARAIENCGCKAAVFECMGQRELWDGESVNRRHRIERRVRCKRDYAPCCAEFDSNAHKERANRIIKNIWGIRFAKWVITFSYPDVELFRDQDSLAEAMRVIAGVLERVTGAEGVIVSLHTMGEKSDRYRPHFECLIPHDGTFEQDLDYLRETLRREIAEALDLQQLANAHFAYVSKELSPKEQSKIWFHKIRYFVHPVVGAERFVRLPDEEAVFAVMILRRLRRVRGFGCFGDRKIKKAAEDLRARFPIELLNESEPEPEVHKGGPCPDCFARLESAEVQHALAGGREIAPDLYLFEFIEQIDLSTLKSLEAGNAYIDWARAPDDGHGPPDDGSSEAA